jgi:hypothetical protein
MKKNLLFTAMASALFAVSMPGILSAQSGCSFKFKTDIIQPTCNGLCNGSIVITPDEPGALYTYVWSTGSTASSIINLCEDEYTITMTDDKNCIESFTFTIEDPDPVIASCIVLSDESIAGAADGSVEASATGGTLPYSFAWQTNPIVYNALLTGLVGGTYHVNVTDANDCPATTSCTVLTLKKDDCHGFRSQTQGGWGQCQQTGNNPGTYLANNFAGAFPGGLTIGCNRTLKLTSATAVCDFLPSGSSPKVLNGNKVNPGQAYSNVFAGQLVAATLNVTFDQYDANFGANAINLGDLEIATGTFAGWSVNDLIAEANRKIGNCASSYSASALSSALEAINENYSDGIVDKGFLVCPDENKDKLISTSEFEIGISPNPVSSEATITVSTVKDDVIEVELFSITGQKAGMLFKGPVAAGDKKAILLDASNLQTGIYIVKVQSSTNVYTQRIVVGK